MTQPISTRQNTLSPFRYPGGKSWLVPRVENWFAYLQKTPDLYIEPFAGGANVGLAVALRSLAKRVVLVERDEQVAVVWQVIFSARYQELIDHIANFDMTLDAVNAALSAQTSDPVYQAFQTILRNRVNHGGILSDSGGRLLNGEDGKGIRSRWYPDTLCNRIRRIAGLRDRISFISGDGIEVIEDYRVHPNAVFFLDPPYSAGLKQAGKRLYRYFELDHERLFDIVADISGDFLMTYDNDSIIRTLAEKHGLALCEIPMWSRKHQRVIELLISRNLTWIDQVR